MTVENEIEMVDFYSTTMVDDFVCDVKTAEIRITHPRQLKEVYIIELFIHQHN